MSYLEKEPTQIVQNDGWLELDMTAIDSDSSPSFAPQTQSLTQQQLAHLTDKMITDVQKMTHDYPRALEEGHLIEYMQQVHMMHLKWVKHLNYLVAEQTDQEKRIQLNTLISSIQGFANKLNESVVLQNYHTSLAKLR